MQTTFEYVRNSRPWLSLTPEMLTSMIKVNKLMLKNPFFPSELMIPAWNTLKELEAEKIARQ